MRRLALAVSIAAAIGIAIPAGSDLGAQERREKKAPKKSTKRAPPPKTGTTIGGYPPCVGVLWVDSLCQLPDGRICFVDEHDLINCKR